MVDNPHYLVRVGGLVCRTRPNGGINHFNGRDVRAKIGTHYGRATLASIRGAGMGAFLVGEPANTNEAGENVYACFLAIYGGHKARYMTLAEFQEFIA